MNITPTVGRIVWFYPNLWPGEEPPRFTLPAEGEPLAAIVAKVHQDGTINVCVIDADGSPVVGIGAIPLIQDGQDKPETGYYATWMPYQVAKAASEQKPA